ncbi:MAG: helix-turn-helix transcriptional regulator [Clostridia bacterium]|nr:helix-turn-helix transcriptional regulator [Clostridia bacterium]
MKREWNDVVITDVQIAVYVAPNSGKHIHKNRPLHGLVFNGTGTVRDYCFSDGRVMHTEGGDLFYLPKYSSYYVKTIRQGGCYAINFDADIGDKPFCVKLKNNESLKKSFKTACDEWRSQAPTRYTAAMRALYDALYLVQKEQGQGYMPDERHRLILPAVEAIDLNYADPSLTVAGLAELCGMSEVYFRKIFIHSFGISPKEYMIRKRMDYAKQLLTLGELGISEIAALCGYSEPCHFSREFKKRYGASPKSYQ